MDMLDLTKEALWGLYVLHFLAKEGGGVSGKRIARHAGISEKTIAPVLAVLRKAGFIAGRSGHGYRLLKTPGLLTLHDVACLFEESGVAARPCTTPYESCSYRESCALSPVCREAHVRAQGTMRDFTIADLRMSSPMPADCSKRKPRREVAITDRPRRGSTPRG